jgi:stearoyl-CoA desaturase (delta-9 desaturase)
MVVVEEVSRADQRGREAGPAGSQGGLGAHSPAQDQLDPDHHHVLGTSRYCQFYLAYCFYQVSGAGLLICLCMANMPYITLLHATWCVNSVCHRFGTRPWNKTIAPADNVWVSLVTNGEGYHNWHHEYPSDWRASKDHWYMLNLTARFL